MAPRGMVGRGIRDLASQHFNGLLRRNRPIDFHRTRVTRHDWILPIGEPEIPAIAIIKKLDILQNNLYMECVKGE